MDAKEGKRYERTGFCVLTTIRNIIRSVVIGAAYARTTVTVRPAGVVAGWVVVRSAMSGRPLR